MTGECFAIPVFRINGVEFSIDCIGIEQRCDEKLRQSVKATLQSVGSVVGRVRGGGSDGEIVIGVFHVRVRVGKATVFAKKFLIISFFRILLGSQKEHVLVKICVALSLL